MGTWRGMEWGLGEVGNGDLMRWEWDLVSGLGEGGNGD